MIGTDPQHLTIPHNHRPSLMIAAEASRFGDQDLRTATKVLEPHFSVRAGRLYQLAELAEARVIVEMGLAVLQGVPSNLLAAALYDALKGFLRRSDRSGETDTGETDFNFRITDEGDKRIVEAALKTNDDEHLRQGLAKLSDLTQSGVESKSFDFDEEAQDWKELG